MSKYIGHILIFIGATILLWVAFVFMTTAWGVYVTSGMGIKLAVSAFLLNVVATLNSQQKQED